MLNYQRVVGPCDNQSLVTPYHWIFHGETMGFTVSLPSLPPKQKGCIKPTTYNGIL